MPAAARQKLAEVLDRLRAEQYLPQTAAQMPA
jgi:hypothetical protein